MSALQIILQRMQLQLTLKNSILKLVQQTPALKCQVGLMSAVRAQAWKFFTEIIDLSSLSINLPNLKIFFLNRLLRTQQVVFGILYGAQQFHVKMLMDWIKFLADTRLSCFRMIYNEQSMFSCLKTREKHSLR